MRRSVEATTDDEWDRVFAVNARGVFAVCRAVLPVMPDGGAIVTVGSMNAFIAWPNDAAYTATKGAVLQFTRALALETAERNIRANCVCPGVIDTPLTRSFLQGDDAAALEREFAEVAPLGRMGTPERGRELHRVPRQRRGVVRDRLRDARRRRHDRPLTIERRRSIGRPVQTPPTASMASSPAPTTPSRPPSAAGTIGTCTTCSAQTCSRAEAITVGQ